MTFTKIRIDSADAAFSRYVRLTHRKCEYCGKPGRGPEGIGGLQASHYWGRRKEATRFCLINVDCLCVGCHRKFTEDPASYRDWKFRQLGEQKYLALSVKANSFKKKDRELEAIIWRQAIKELGL